MEKAEILRERYKNVTVNYVAALGQIRVIPALHSYFKEKGFKFHVDPDETANYSKQQIEFLKPYLSGDRRLGVQDFIEGEKLCNAGQKQVHILPDGTVFRCYYDRKPLGNLFTHFRLYSEPQPCTLRCGSGCDLDSVDIWKDGKLIHKSKK